MKKTVKLFLDSISPGELATPRIHQGTILRIVKGGKLDVCERPLFANPVTILVLAL